MWSSCPSAACSPEDSPIVLPGRAFVLRRPSRRFTATLAGLAVLGVCAAEAAPDGWSLTGSVSERLSVDRVEARKIQKKFFFEHGTTLRGLMLEHDITPDDFLGYVHDIDHSVLDANPDLDAVLGRLPGRKLIFTSGTVAHAEHRVVTRVDVGGGCRDLVLAVDIVRVDTNVVGQCDVAVAGIPERGQVVHVADAGG